MKLITFNSSYVSKFSSWFLKAHPGNEFIQFYMDTESWLRLVENRPNRYTFAAISRERLVGFADVELSNNDRASFAFGIAPSLEARGLALNF